MKVIEEPSLPPKQYAKLVKNNMTVDISEEALLSHPYFKKETLEH